MTQLYPLIFTPLFKERVWGGRRLTRWFPTLPDGPVGEAWVLSDHPQGRTPVANGPLRGETIQSLKARFGTNLLGRRGLHPRTGEFPLLFKLLDCQDDLSIQVHPSDDSPGLPPGELGKSEMWVVLEAEPGAKVVYGLKEGVTPDSFAAAVAQGRTMDVMRQLEVRPGDVLYVPAGTVHALGTGLLVAEIQQSSDTTYRLYDYDRPGLDGKPRELHVEQALAVATYGPPPQPSHPPEPDPNQWQVIVTSPFFETARARCAGDWLQQTTPDSFEALMLLEGEGVIAWPGGEERLTAGMTLLIPAALGSYRLRGEFRLLRVRV
ncbi:MAG: type I phosphomannose isomerase catalytic subunit [Bacillota bacterium]